MSKRKTSRASAAGFTLIELLVVIGLIVLLSTAIFVALNPASRFADARNARRTNDVNSIATAINQCIVDNDGSLTACGITTTVSETLGTGDLDLSTELAPYLSSIPLDPDTGTAADTGYSIQANSDNIITVRSDDEENGAVIEVSR